jgi:signal transduction histidine kinase
MLDGVYKTGVPFIAHEVPFPRVDEMGNSSLLYLNVDYHPFRAKDGTIKGVLAYVQDVTESVEARKRVEHSVAELQAERDIREHFVATLSHDLRTPLTAAKISAQILGRKSGDPDSIHRISGRVVSNLERADAMIRDLLDASRLRAGQKIGLEMSEGNLGEVVRATLEELSTIHGDRFILKSPETVNGTFCAGGIRRILENLCSNAIKYGSREMPITIQLALKNQNIAELSVHNHGPVIAPEDQVSLFNAYHRTDSAKATERGWGLGLTLIKGLADAHQGTVSVTSTSESGTTFLVSLKINQ